MTPTNRTTLGKMQNPVRGLLHGSAAVAAVVGGLLLILQADTWPSRIALLVFVLAMVALYTTSSLYHSIPWRELWKQRMQRIDHAMIFVLIAGTHTPVQGLYFRGYGRWAVLLLM